VVKTGIPMLKKQMSKFTLDIEYDFNFILIGISCHEKDYRISWALRERLAIDLCRGEDIVIASKKPGVSNRTDSSFLVPEQRSVDYFLIARGGYDAENQEEIVQQIRGIPFVLTAFAIDAESLKSRQNLIF
jgi:hypothetical protein